MAESEVTFVLRGESYPMPPLDKLTLGERSAIQRIVGEGAEDADGADPRTLSALFFIAYRRGNPRVSERAAERFVSSLTDDEWEVEVSEEQSDEPA